MSCERFGGFGGAVRLFRAVRAVGLSLYLCAACARLCVVYAPCGGMPALYAPGRGSSVVLCGGRSTTVFSRSHLKPSRVFAVVFRVDPDEVCCSTVRY